MNTEPTKPAQEEEEDSRVRQIVDLGSSVVTNDHGTVHCLTVIGQIEGHGQAPSGTKTTKYEHVLPLLASIEESQEVDGLLVLLHTMGGDVEAGLAIAEMIAGMTKPTVTLVLGGGHSIGIPLAVSGKVTLCLILIWCLAASKRLLSKSCSLISRLIASFITAECGRPVMFLIRLSSSKAVFVTLVSVCLFPILKFLCLCVYVKFKVWFTGCKADISNFRMMINCLNNFHANSG